MIAESHDRFAHFDRHDPRIPPIVIIHPWLPLKDATWGLSRPRAEIREAPRQTVGTFAHPVLGKVERICRSGGGLPYSMRNARGATRYVPLERPY